MTKRNFTTLIYEEFDMMGLENVKFLLENTEDELSKILSVSVLPRSPESQARIEYLEKCCELMNCYINAREESEG